MKEKRISFIIENLDGGGAERVITNLMNYLVDSGWKVDLILVRKEGVFLQFLNPAVTIFELPVSNLLSSLIPLIRHLIKHQPSVIISSLDLMNAITILAV